MLEAGGSSGLKRGPTTSTQVSNRCREMAQYPKRAVF